MMHLIQTIQTRDTMMMLISWMLMCSRTFCAWRFIIKYLLEMPWAPFSSHLDWDIAQWAKMYSQTSTAVTELLAIPGVCHSSFLNTMPLIHKIKVVEQLGLSYHTVKELNEMIDDELPGCPPFQCKEVTFNDERLEFYHRDILQCIWVIYCNIQFAPNLVFAPVW